MQNIYGTRITLLDEAKMNSQGTLVDPRGIGQYTIPADAIELFIIIASAGDSGISKKKLPARFRENLAEPLLHLEMQDLVRWESNKRGVAERLVLTWKGEETLQAAKPRQGPKLTYSEARKASIRQYSRKD